MIDRSPLWLAMPPPALTPRGSSETPDGPAKAERAPAPSFEAMVGDHAGPLQVPAKPSPERPIDARLSPDLRLFEQLKAPIERELP